MEKLKVGAERLGIYLTPEQLEQFEVYYRELLDGNRKINLTRITGYEEVQVKHFLDSLSVTLGMKPPVKDRTLKVMDVGAGAGVPGLPLKIVFPDIELTLLEATARKVKFLHHVIGKLGLDKAEAVNGRAEETAHDARYRENFDLVISRAVAPLPALVELTLPFCKLSGRFIALKKGGIRAEIAKAGKAIGVMGGVLREVRTVGLAGLDDERYLVIIDKVKSTPPEYPRRPGMPAKRPLVS
jgi:16S rRNA (guanine527-N7)-methyltransferase